MSVLGPDSVRDKLLHQLREISLLFWSERKRAKEEGLDGSPWAGSHSMSQLP
jgi:hypothetical protein